MRKSKSLTQKQLAALLDIDQTSVSHWERGKGIPDMVNLLKLANVFDVSLDYLTGRDDKITSETTAMDFHDIMEYAVSRGLTPEDIKQVIDFAIRMKDKQCHFKAP